MKKLLLVGLWVAENDWEFCGVFDNKEQALERCAQKNNFIWLIELNKNEPEERTKKEEFNFYPKIENEPDWFSNFK